MGRFEGLPGIKEIFNPSLRRRPKSMVGKKLRIVRRINSRVDLRMIILMANETVLRKQSIGAIRKR